MVANSKVLPWALMIAAVALFIFVALFVKNRTPGSGIAGEAIALRSDSPSSPYSQGSGFVKERSGSHSEAATKAAETAAIVGLLAEYRCAPADADCRSNPFAATSEKEAKWLRANGFPTPRELQESRQVSVQYLDERARSGNTISQSVYADRLLEEGNLGGALGVSLHAANRGNLYALYQLAQIYAADGPRKDPLTAKAYLRLAYLAGDYKVSGRLANTFPEFNNPSEQAFVDRRAVELHRKLLNGHIAPRPIEQ